MVHTVRTVHIITNIQGNQIKTLIKVWHLPLVLQQIRTESAPQPLCFPGIALAASNIHQPSKWLSVANLPLLKRRCKKLILEHNDCRGTVTCTLGIKRLRTHLPHHQLFQALPVPLIKTERTNSKVQIPKHANSKYRS